MLYEITRVYMDYYEDKEIISGNPRLSFKGEGIRGLYAKPFKYKVEKHNLLCTTIAKLSDKYYIMPQGIECHPDTTLNDILETKSETQVKKEKEEKKLEQPKTWKFQSSSGNGTYTVRFTKKGTLTCDCFGAIRSKGNCKHIKEVRSWGVENGKT